MAVELLHTEAYQPSAGADIIRCKMLFEQRTLFASLSDGTIAIWHRRTAEASHGRSDSKQQPKLLEGHSGTVHCMLLARQEGLGQEDYLLLSGGADRTVRVWDPSVRDLKKTCVQTLRGHGGSVTSVAYAQGVLISSSTDTTIKLWKADEGRELLLYPWFSLLQTLDDLGCWVSDMALQLGEGGALYVADEQGTLSAYQVVPATRTSPLALHKWRRQPKAHSLGITRLLLVPEEQFIVTSAYDNSVRVFDSQAGGMLLTIDNIHKCRFTALHWDVSHQELLLGDDLGYVYFWDVATEKCIKCQRLCEPDTARGAQSGGSDFAIRELCTAADEVVVSAAGACDVWLVLRDVKYSEIRGHTGAVTALCVSDVGAKQQASVSGGDPQVIYSASLDNTIRAWDPYDMAVLSVLTEQHSEISCLFVSSLCEFLVSGNDDGSIRLWNPDSGSTISLSGHTNTVCCLDVGVRGGAELLLSSGAVKLGTGRQLEQGSATVQQR